MSDHNAPHSKKAPDSSQELPPALREIVFARAFHTLDDVAQIGGFSRRHAYTLASLGHLRLTKLGRRLTRVAADDLAAFLVRARAGRSSSQST